MTAKYKVSEVLFHLRDIHLRHPTASYVTKTARSQYYKISPLSVKKAADMLYVRFLYGLNCSSLDALTHAARYAVSTGN